jgi:hypothetical protein
MSNASPELAAGERVFHPEMGAGVFIATEPGGYPRPFFQKCSAESWHTKAY